MTRRIIRIAIAVILASFVLATAALLFVDLKNEPSMRALIGALFTG